MYTFVTNYIRAKLFTYFYDVKTLTLVPQRLDLVRSVVVRALLFTKLGLFTKLSLDKE